jgi:23S rRNA (uracil1939-C5)-methyltransferase
MLVTCPVQAACGGCPLMNSSAAEQRAQKLEVLRAALADRELEPGAVTFFGRSPEFGYRNRIRLKIRASGEVCFFNPEKAETCAVLEPALQEQLSGVLALSREQPELFAGFQHLELRGADLRQRFGMALIAAHPEASPAPLAAALARSEAEWLVGLTGRADIPCQEYSPDGALRALVPLDAFWQINSAVNRALVQAVVTLVHGHGARTALDLYAGAGNFSIPLAARGLEVSAVESHGSAMTALALAAQGQGLTVSTRTELAEHACARLAAEKRHFDVVVVDGPRAGAKEVMASLAELAPSAVAICSCNPLTLARDLALLTALGYRLEQLQAFDMFPHTRHLEVLAWLTRA